jgi:hypothetical protein
MIKSDFLPDKKTIRPAFFIYSGLLIILLGIIYGLNISPALYYDDFKVFAYRFFTHDLPWFIPGFVRPLSYATFRLETELFGMNLLAQLIFRLCLLIIQGLLFFVIFEKLHIFPTILNFISAILITISPVDMTRMWLAVEPLRMIFVQIYMICLLIYTEKRSIPAFIIGVIFGFTLLLNYEAQLGMVLIFPILLFFLYRIKEKQTYWFLLSPLGIGMAYLLFRAFGPVFGITDFHFSQTITPIYILRQIRNGIVCHITGWYLPLITDEIIRKVTLLALISSFGTFIFYSIRYGFENDKRIKLQRAGLLIAIGCVFWLAGYFPWIAYGVPSYMHWFSSRAHNFSIIGAILVLIAVIDFLGSIVRVGKTQKLVISVMLTVPFLVIGSLSQMAIQRETKILWDDYKAMWNGIFAAIPNIKDNSHVVLVISPYYKNIRYGERDFLTNASFNSEISLSLEMFYPGQKLEGEFMYKDVEVTDTPILTNSGIKNSPTYSGTIPYADIVFIKFDRETSKVSIIRDLKDEFGIDNSTYNADSHIDSVPKNKPSLRYIFTN